MITYLNVPYEDRHKAKAAGAMWNPARKRWYVENVDDLTGVYRWLDKGLTEPHRETPYEREFKERQNLSMKSKKDMRRALKKQRRMR